MLNFLQGVNPSKQMSNDKTDFGFGAVNTHLATHPSEYDHIGRYKVVRKLGQGAMGDVYEGYHPELELKVAIKIINKGLLGEEVLVERFKDEAKAVSNIGNQGLVRVFDLGTCDDGRLYMAMEYLEGRDLEEALLDHKVFTTEEIVLMATQITSALAPVHDRGIIHRDIKPANIYLVDDEDHTFQVKILDFGIAKLAKKNGSGSKKTQLGQIMGTPDYMAPEQIESDGTIDHRADIYSLGCVLYELLSGESPFKGESIQNILMAHMTETPAALHTLNNSVSKELSDLVHECLNKSPADRPQDMRVLKKHFIELKGNTQLNLSRYQTFEDNQAAPTADESKKKSSKWLPTIGVLSLVLLGAFVFLKPKSEKTEDAPPPNADTSAVPAGKTKTQTPPDPQEKIVDNTNPYTIKDEKALSEGALLFGTHCARCHGANGDGHGSETPADISPKALNVQDIEPGILDMYRYKIIGEGISDQMPAFSTTLTSDETWKVVTFVNTLAKAQSDSTTSKANAPTQPSSEKIVEPKLTPALKNAGAKLYKKHCESCHGAKGGGYGRAAEYLGRRPANLRKGIYKIRSTPKYSIPTNLDIFNTLTKGMGVHGMPSFKRLTQVKRWSLVAYIKSFSKRFQKEKPEDLLEIPKVPSLNGDAVKRGKDLYHFSACAKCHGDKGQGDGPKAKEIIAKVGKDYRLPNFAVMGSFIGGYKPEEIYKTLMTGIAGTPMPAGTDFFSPEEAWDVVAYIRSFAK